MSKWLKNVASNINQDSRCQEREVGKERLELQSLYSALGATERKLEMTLKHAKPISEMRVIESRNSLNMLRSQLT